MSKTWRKLNVSKTDLQLGPTLNGGQSFRWKNFEADSWIGVFRNKVWIFTQSDDHISYQCRANTLSKTDNIINKENGSLSENHEDEIEKMLKLYFRLDVDLSHYYKTWSEADSHFKKAASNFYGIRILNQEVAENIFSFICSSNNNIKRISTMVEKLCTLFGDPIADVNKETFFSFPTIESLTSPTVESDLRKAGFGYRAKFIHQSACIIEKLGGTMWLEGLKLLPYPEAKKELMKLPGVGAKVADCICLMSLGHMEAVPVDTHIFQLASAIHLPHLKKNKSFTDKVYNEVADYYRSLYGDYAGWAQTVLFCSDLKILLPDESKKKRPSRKEKKC